MKNSFILSEPQIPLFAGRKKRITDQLHPEYLKSISDWRKYRLTFEGGDNFITNYLQRFSVRETSRDFQERKSVTYSPSLAKAAIVDIKNAIYQRMIDINREGGSESYQKAVRGENNGVDLQGNNMTGFIGRLVLPELLSIGKVGVFVDKPPVPEGASLNETSRINPYIYTYHAEDILSWRYDNQKRLKTILLRDRIEVEDSETGLVTDIEDQYRLLRYTDDGIISKIYDTKGEESSVDILDLKEIPFVVFEISQSLLVDVANYQIAYLNIASSDVNYILKSNFPFYVEQYDMMAEMTDLRQSNAITTDDNGVITDSVKAGTASAASTASDREIQVGVTKGRRYPKSVDKPDFIHPSPEPLLASLEKQSQLRAEIRQLVNLAVTNVSSKSSSAESKEQDEHSLEAGLSNIGLELEFGESRIAAHWSEYEKDNAVTVIKYPNNYSLKTDEDRRKEAREMREELPTIPSKTYQREVAKQITTITMGNKVTVEKLKQMHAEIDASAVVVTDPDVIQQDHEAGFVGTDLASKLRGYPEGEAEQAKQDHAERLARIQAAQQRDAARGVKDADDDVSSGRKEKILSKVTDKDDVVRDKTRGEGK